MAGAATDFPGLYPVLINDRAFDIDTSYEAFRRQSFHHDTIPAQRESLELTDVPGEGTLNTEGLWRRGQVSWHHGAGQLYADRKESDNLRFLSSLGVDPWNQNQLTLLPATVQRVNDGGAYNWCSVAVATSYVYHLQGNANPDGAARVRWTQDWSTFHTPTGAPATNIFCITTDGVNIYICSEDATSPGVYVTTAGGASWTRFITDPVDHLFWVGDRLIACVGPDVWDITGANTQVASNLDVQGYKVMSHNNASWNWLDFTAGTDFIYGCGVVGNPGATQVGASKVYAFSTQPGVGGIPAGVNLTSGVQALTLENGEFAGTLYAYQNYIFVGTNLGIRTCRTISQYDPTGAAGSLVSGPILPNLTQPIQAPLQPYIGNFVSGIVGYDRWVWFSWPQFTYGGTTYWALGRLDLGNFIADLQPAFASDLTVSTNVTSGDSHHTLDWDPVTNGPLMVVPSTNGGSYPNNGIYTQDYNVSITNATKYMATGYLRSGRITYGMQDDKTVAQANLKTAAANAYAPFDTAGGSVALDVSYDEGAFAALTPLAPNTQANPPVLVTPLTQAEEIEVEAILTAGSVTHTDDSRPFLTRWTIKSLPNVVSGILIYVALKLFSGGDIEGATTFTDPYNDYAYLENLRLSQEIVTYKEAAGVAGSSAFQASVVVQELYWMPHKKRENADGGFEGVLVVTLKSIVG